MVVHSLILSRRGQWCVELQEERGQWMTRKNALKIRYWQMFFGLESGATTEGWASLVLCYDHINSIIRNTQLLYMLLCSYWLPNSDIPEIFDNSTTIVFYLNYAKGL